MFQFPRCPPRIARWVPGRAPGGLPHSETSGSPAASASPEHFAAWPRPSSAANAKASTMRPSCGGPHPSPLCRDRRCSARQAEPARARETLPPPGSQPGSAPRSPHAISAGSGPSPPVPALRRRPGPVSPGHPALRAARCCPFGSVSPWSVVCVCFLFRAVRAGDPTRAPPPHRSRCGDSLESRAAPPGHRVVPRPQNPTGSAWRVVNVQEDTTVFRRPSGRHEVVKPRPKSSSDLGRGLPTRHQVEPRGFEPRTSAVQGRRSPG
jgi:hypothetical protein